MSSVAGKHPVADDRVGKRRADAGESGRGGECAGASQGSFVRHAESSIGVFGLIFGDHGNRGLRHGPVEPVAEAGLDLVFGQMVPQGNEAVREG